jgi:hypothetical protein
MNVTEVGSVGLEWLATMDNEIPRVSLIMGKRDGKRKGLYAQFWRCDNIGE